MARTHGRHILVAAENETHGGAGLAGQHYRDKLARCLRLAAETATDFAGDHLYLRDRKLEYLRGLLARAEGSLGGSPDRELAVLIPMGCCDVRFDIALVDGLGREFSFDNDMRGFEGRLGVAALEVMMV